MRPADMHDARRPAGVAGSNPSRKQHRESGEKG